MQLRHAMIEWDMPYDSFYAGIQMQYALEVHLSYSMTLKNNLI
jgi:hypothetical protein